MPEISRFLGIVIRMYYDDHTPPHFHARYGEYQMSVVIETGKIMDGKFPKRAGRLVEEWRAQNTEQLMINWRRAVSEQPLQKIEPLE